MGSVETFFEVVVEVDAVDEVPFLNFSFKFDVMMLDQVVWVER